MVVDRAYLPLRLHDVLRVGTVDGVYLDPRGGFRTGPRRQKQVEAHKLSLLFLGALGGGGVNFLIAWVALSGPYG